MSTMMMTIMSKTHSFPHGRTQTRRRRRGGGGRCSRRRRSEARHDDDRKNISSSSSSSSSSPQCVLCRRFDDIYIQFFCGDKIMDTKKLEEVFWRAFFIHGTLRKRAHYTQTRVLPCGVVRGILALLRGVSATTHRRVVQKTRASITPTLFSCGGHRGHYLSIHRSALLPLSTVRFSSPCFSESCLSRSRRRRSSRRRRRRTAATTLRIYPSIPSSPLSRASRPRRNTSSLCSPTRILFRLARRRRAR